MKSITLINNLLCISQDGEVSVEEFKRGIETTCKGKSYEDLPKAFKFFIDSSFRTIDINGKGPFRCFHRPVRLTDADPQATET